MELAMPGFLSSAITFQHWARERRQALYIHQFIECLYELVEIFGHHAVSHIRANSLGDFY
jgi:hypothetical protein